MRWHPLNGYGMSFPAAVPWRVDIPDPGLLAANRLYRNSDGHEYGRPVTVAGLEWIWCKTHRGWHTLPLSDAA